MIQVVLNGGRNSGHVLERPDFVAESWYPNSISIPISIAGDRDVYQMEKLPDGSYMAQYIKTEKARVFVEPSKKRWVENLKIVGLWLMIFCVAVVLSLGIIMAAVLLNHLIFK